MADIEHELDDAYDDLQPLLRAQDCKDDNVRAPWSPILGPKKGAPAVLLPPAWRTAWGPFVGLLHAFEIQT